MPDYHEHIKRSNENLQFLEKINGFDNYWDWKVTACFYSALHLINAHISRKIDYHYRSHSQVETAINPNHIMSPTRVSEDIYYSYIALQNLSRRARYLVHEKPDNKKTDAFFTYEKHLKRAIYHLDIVITFFNTEYSDKINRIVLPSGLKNNDIKNFDFKEMKISY